MKVNEIKKGDIVTYRNGRTNNVNKPNNYIAYYYKNFRHRELESNFDIVKIQRYVKFLCFYRLVTIYERD